MKRWRGDEAAAGSSASEKGGGKSSSFDGESAAKKPVSELIYDWFGHVLYIIMVYFLPAMVTIAWVLLVMSLVGECGDRVWIAGCDRLEG